LEIASAVLDAVHAHALEAWPNECCGLLIGTSSRIERALRARNLEDSPTRFVVDPADHFAALRSARGDGRDVVGVYHSHPSSPPTPSETDLAEAAYSEFVYLIVTPARDGRPPETRAYRLTEDRFVPVELVAEDAGRR
jgi:proteasome lid subunit RPN8/RPN11